MKIGFPALVIANGGTASSELGFNQLRFLRSLTIGGPAALTGTVTVQVRVGRSGSDWKNLQQGGADVTITAGDAVTIDPVPFGGLRVLSSGAEGAERSFPVMGLEVC